MLGSAEPDGTPRTGSGRRVYFNGAEYSFLNYGGRKSRVEPIRGGGSFLAPTAELYHDPAETERITRDSIVSKP